MKLKHLIALLFAHVLVSTAIAQSGVIPIVELKNRGLMGGVEKGRWVSSTVAAGRLRSETEFVLVGWNGVEEGGVTLGKKGEAEDVCQDFTRMEFDLQQENGVANGS